MSSEQFRYLHFDVRPNRRRLKDNEASLHCKKSGSTTYAITINQKVSSVLRNDGLNYAKVRVDNFTGDAFLVFVAEQDNDTISIRYSKSGENCNAQILGKSIIEWFCEWYGIKNDSENVRKVITIGYNLSRVENVVVFKLNKELIK